MNGKIKFGGVILVFSILLLANVCIALGDNDVEIVSVNALVEEEGNVHSECLKFDLGQLNIANIISDDINNLINNNKLIGFNA